ncbi:MAG TPA: hypothetical protein VKU19_22185 [Bryobacteraceae bacterium]|nr:hypothetical protein [Bryobacteraceae bacterium]
MNARILTTSTLALAVVAVLPANAADPQLLNLVMPDAKVLVGVNVDQAKTSPFGQYVLSQMQTQDQEMKKLESQTGFDPTRDVHELLVATSAVGNSASNDQTGLFLARGSFDAAKVTAAATADQAITENYKGVTIIEDPKGTHGVAFLSPTLAIGGDIANVKSAIDRQAGGPTISAALMTQVNQWSNSQDAWLVSIVPPSTLHAPATAPNVPGLNGTGAFNTVQSAAGGVKFGSLVVVTGQAQSDNAQDAQQMGDAIKMLGMLAQMQAQKDPAASALAQSLQVTTSGSTVNVSISMPQDQLQQLLKPKPNVRRAVR